MAGPDRLSLPDEPRISVGCTQPVGHRGKLMIPDYMKRLDSRPIPDKVEEIRAFLVVRNEALRLPSTLQHHRAIGVNRFFVLDNGSTDGTLDFLATEPDVHLFSTEASYAASHYGVVWTNALLDAYGTGHWTLTIDADELFIYPHYEQLDLPLFCRFLDYVGAQGVACLLLDMYSDRAVQDTVHDSRTSLLSTCQFFDPGPYRLTRVNLCPYVEIYGGVRERIFRDMQAQFHAPTVSKAPLVRWREGTRYLQSTHFITPVKIANVMAALLHFKFLSDFHDRVQTEVARGEHFAGAREYRAYLDLLRKQGAVNLFGEKSVRFEGSRQLSNLGLMTSSKAYEDSVRLTLAARAAQPLASAG